MEECEYLLKVDEITDTCVAAENKRWYRVRWKSMWISDKVISPTIFQKTQNGKVHIIGNNTSYDILGEKMKEDGHFDFLLSSGDSWELDEKLRRKFSSEIASYWASKSNTSELIKIEDISDDEGRSCCMSNSDTDPRLVKEMDVVARIPSIKDETRFSQCCSGNVGNTNGTSNSLGNINGTSNSVGNINGTSNSLGHFNGSSNSLGNINGTSNSLVTMNGTSHTLGTTNGTSNTIGTTNGTPNSIGTTNHVSQQACVTDKSTSQPLHQHNTQTLSQNGFHSYSPPSTLFHNNVKPERGVYSNSCSRQFATIEEININDKEPPLLLTLADESSSLSNACTLPGDRFSPTIIKIEDDYPNLCDDNESMMLTSDNKSDVVKIEDDDYPSACGRQSTTQVAVPMSHVSAPIAANNTSISPTAQQPVMQDIFNNGIVLSPNRVKTPGNSSSSPVVIKIEDDDKESPVSVHENNISSNNGHHEKSFNDTSMQNPQFPNVNIHIPHKLAHMSIRETNGHLNSNNTSEPNRSTEANYPVANGHPSNSPPPLISVSAHSPTDIQHPHNNDSNNSNNGMYEDPSYPRRHSADLDGRFGTVTSMESRCSPPDRPNRPNRPPLLIPNGQPVPHNFTSQNMNRYQEDTLKVTNNDKNKYQVVITNGTNYKCEICGKEFKEFNEVCEHRKSHGNNRRLSPIKIEDENDVVDVVANNNNAGNILKPIPSKEMMHPPHNQHMIANGNYRFVQPMGDEAYQPSMDPKQPKVYNPQLQSSRNFRIQTNCNVQTNQVVYSSTDHRLSGNVHGSMVMPQHVSMSNNKEHFFSKSYPPPNPISYVAEYQAASSHSHAMRNKTNMFKPAHRERSASSLDSYLSVNGQVSPHSYHPMPVSPDKGRSRPINGMVDVHFYSHPKSYMMPNDHVLNVPTSQGIRKSMDCNPCISREKLPYQLQPRIIPNSGAVRPHPINHMEINRFPPHPADYHNPQMRQNGFAPPPPQGLHKVPENSASASIIKEKQLASQRMQAFYDRSPINYRGINDVATRQLRPPIQVQPYYPPSNYPRNHVPSDVPPTLTKMPPTNYPPTNGELLTVHQLEGSLQKRQITPPRYPKCDICGKNFADYISLKEHRASHVNEQAVMPRSHIKEEPDPDYSPSNVFNYRKDVPTEIIYPSQDQFTSENNHHSPVNPIPHQRSPVNPMPLAGDGQVDNHVDIRRPPSNHDVDNLDVANPQQNGGSPRIRPIQQHFMQNHDATMVDTSQARAHPSSFLLTPPMSEETSLDNIDVSHDPLLRTSGESETDENILEKVHKCETCKITFEDYARLKEHRKTHVTEKQFSCELCDKTFTQNSTLKRHQRTHTREKPYKCEICGKSFSHNYNLKEHGKTHTGEKPYKCLICLKTFAQNYHLKEHQTTHSDAKPFKCDKCNKQFSLDSYLKKHQKIHTGEKPYKCDVCDKQFLQNSHLKDHRRIHTGEKPFRCEICGIRFSQNYTLKIHQRTHTGEKPYKCEVCMKRFSQNSHLKEHRTRTHSGDKPFKCDQCHKEFSLDSYLKKHQKIHSGEKPFKCDICGKQFSQNYHLKEHRRIHTGEKPYKCQICEMRFSQNCSLKIHQRIHTGEKPYECEICGKQFSHSSNVKTHKRVHLNEKAPPASSQPLGSASKPSDVSGSEGGSDDVRLTTPPPVTMIQPTPMGSPT